MNRVVNNRLMGPVVCGTIVASDLDVVVNAYVDFLEMKVSSDETLPEALAKGWGLPELKGTRTIMLQSKSGYAWLRLIQQLNVPPAKPISRHGWMSLEVLVSDVFDLAEKLKGSLFTFIGQPAKLDVSDSITACQVVGPGGEVLYLTSIAEPVPPFELPIATVSVDRLFIPVLSVPDRKQAVDFYEVLANSKALSFDTKVTVINRALERHLETKIPVATIQLNGESLIEIDEVKQFVGIPSLQHALPSGIAVVTFAVTSLESITTKPVSAYYVIEDGFYEGKKAAMFRGPAGEYVELIEAV